MSVTRRKSTTTSRLRNGAHQRVDAMADSIDSLSARASEYVDHGRARASELVESFEDTIRQRPLTAILGGAAVGFLIGCLMMRR